MSKFYKDILRKTIVGLLAVSLSLSSVESVTASEIVAESTTEAETEVESVTEAETEVESTTDAERTTEIETQTSMDQPESETDSWDGVTTDKIFEGENYKVTFTLTSHWDAGYNANVKLENTGDSTIQNWYLGFDYNNSITNIWNAEVSSNEDNKYVIKNVGWNQDIATGNSI